MNAHLNPPVTVAVTGMNARPDNPGPGLAVARCLAEDSNFRGRIVGLSYDVLDPGLYLQDMCDSAYLLPYPSSGEQQLLERLREIQQQEQIDVLIPCLDAELPAFSRLAPQLEAMGIRMLLPSTEQLAARNKDRLAELCHSVGLNSPATCHVTSAEFFHRAPSLGWHYPMVIKGLFYDAAVVRNAEEAAAQFHKIAAQWGLPVLAQQFIEGEEVNLTALGDGAGNMLGAVPMRKRATTDKGKAWAGVTIDDPQLLELSRRLIAGLRWPGPLEIEVLRDRAGEYHLLEINPRFPAWIYLSHGAGCNLPSALVRLACGEQPLLPVCPPGVTFIRYAQEQVIPLDDYQQMTMVGGRKAAQPAALKVVEG